MEGHKETGGPSYFFEENPMSLLNRGTRICLFLDFDGTLVPIRKNPEECVLPPDIKDLLKAITASGTCAVTVLSGRSLPDIQRKVDLDGIYHGGNHGLIISGPDMTFVHPEALGMMRVIERVRRGLEKEISGVPGVWIEDKELSFTLHFREAPDGTGRLLGAMFRRILSGVPEKQHLILLKGKKVLELAPHARWDKGKAALFVLSTFGSGWIPVYVGDDVTDEFAFRALEGKGITVRVGTSKRTVARYYLKRQGEVRQLLGEIEERRVRT